NVDDTLEEMARLKDDDVLNARVAIKTLHLGDVELTDEVAPKGLRLLRRVVSLPPELSIRIANHFGGLARLQRATIADLAEVDGVDETTAREVKATLDRVTENTILEQY